MMYICKAVSYTAWAISNYQVSQKCPHDEEVYAKECVSHIYRAKTIKYDSDDDDDGDSDDDDDGDDNSDSDDDDGDNSDDDDNDCDITATFYHYSFYD